MCFGEMNLLRMFMSDINILCWHAVVVPVLLLQTLSFRHLRALPQDWVVGCTLDPRWEREQPTERGETEKNIWCTCCMPTYTSSALTPILPIISLPQCFCIKESFFIFFNEKNFWLAIILKQRVFLLIGQFSNDFFTKMLKIFMIR